jgi:hypothetical protein
MSKFNILLHLNAYEDASATNLPTLNAFKWHRDFQGFEVAEPKSQAMTLNSLESQVLHDSTVTLLADNTTSYNLALTTSGIYELKHNSGTAPAFRTKRAIGGDATTEITITRNASILTFTVSAGTAPSFTSVQIGDEMKIDAPFNASNKGRGFKVIAKTSNSVSIVNDLGVAEVAVLGADFAQNFKIYSSSPVVSGQTVELKTGFSLVTLGSYDIAYVEDDRIAFDALDLPIESNVIASISVYSNNKKMIYIESNQLLTITINDTASFDVKPQVLSNKVVPGMFLLNSIVYKLEISNKSINQAKVYYASVE